MHPLKLTGKIFYGIGVAGIGLLHFIYPGFRPFMLPIPAEATKDLSILVYLTGAILIAAGLYIAFFQKVKSVALYLGLLFLSFFLFGHLPNRLTNHPEILGMWIDALKILSFSGGAFIVATAFIDNKQGSLEKFAQIGKYFFALLLVLFGLTHFIYLDFVKPLVPRWIPGGELPWTYIGGIALIGSGVAIFVNFKPKLIGILLGTMLFIWLMILHIPRAIAAPPTDNGNELTSVFQALAFSGMAFLYAVTKNTSHKNLQPLPKI